MPLSGIISTQELMKRQPAGSMGGTYAGNAVSCAAAIATLDVIKKENIIQNVNERAAQLEAGLRLLAKEFSCIKDIRGKGLTVLC
jgi:4-aminobutyrate aminotransferase